MEYKRLTLFAGHYGSGKTNLALNWARWLRGKGLSVTVADAEGRTVRRLLTRQATRPEKLRPGGTSLSWSGRLANGEPAPPGTYHFHIRAWVGEEEYAADSPAFALLAEEESADQEYPDLRFVPE